MPGMYEIYEKHADRYHELVLAEDYQGNLGQALHTLFDWQGKTVLEAGVGTGRVTRLIADDFAQAVCCDRSLHMLEFARHNLKDYAAKLKFYQAENLQLPQLDQKFDAFIQGWSFGHALADCDGERELNPALSALLRGAERNLKRGGIIFFIESLGTTVNLPQAPLEQLAWFYAALEHQHGYSSHQIRTDYYFSSVEEAARVIGFFFGDAMREIVQNLGKRVIPEWTGIWTKIV